MLRRKYLVSLKKQKSKKKRKKNPESNEKNEMSAPQIKIESQGELIGEQSLVIENKKLMKNREDLEKFEVVSRDSKTGFRAYKRAERLKDCSERKTPKFYKSLNTTGTNFTLMCELFHQRSRVIKKKLRKKKGLKTNGF